MLLEKTIAENLIADLTLGPFAAGEPVDLAIYTGITPEAAAVLARDFRGEVAVGATSGESGPGAPSCFELDLSGLKSIDLESARALARWNPVADEPDEASCTLDLGGLRRSPPRVLAALATWSVSAATACLVLDGFRNLGMARAKALGRWSGGNLSSHLHLSNLAGLAPDEAAGLTAGYLETLAIGPRELPLETAVRLGQAGYQRLVFTKLERIDPPALLALAGLTPEGKLRPEYTSPEFARPEPIELFLANACRAPLRDLTKETVEAIDTVRQLGVKVHLSRATIRQLRDLR